MPRKSKALKNPVTPAISLPIPLPPDNSSKALNEGVRLQQAGKIEEAIKRYDEVLKRNPRKLGALVNKGAALRRLGRHSDALPWFLRALAIEQDNAEVWQNMGNTLLDMGRKDEAKEALTAALAKAPHQPEVWFAIARLLLADKHYAAGELALKRAVSLRPDFATRLELATLWLEQGENETHLHKCLEEYRALEALQPDNARVQGGIGQSLIGLGRMKEALPYLKRSTAMDPKHLDARLGLARWYLLMGDYENGWPAYEARRERTDKKKPKIEGIEWDGSDPKGKTIMVYAEQGFGDTIQFLRFLTPLAKRGAKVIVVCQKALVSLVERVEGVAKATCLWRPMSKYDFYVPLLSLPYKLKLGGKDLPGQIPYITTNRQANFPPAPLGTKMRVGLVWAGSATNPDDHNRTTGLEALLPLTGVAGVRFYSLQVGPRAKDVEKHAHPALIADFSKHLNEYADTASVIKELDLVISEPFFNPVSRNPLKLAYAFFETDRTGVPVISAPGGTQDVTATHAVTGQVMQIELTKESALKKALETIGADVPNTHDTDKLEHYTLAKFIEKGWQLKIEDSFSAAVREAKEEQGIDLTSPAAYIGAPQQYDRSAITKRTIDRIEKINREPLFDIRDVGSIADLKALTADIRASAPPAVAPDAPQRLFAIQVPGFGDTTPADHPDKVENKIKGREGARFYEKGRFVTLEEMAARLDEALPAAKAEQTNGNSAAGREIVATYERLTIFQRIEAGLVKQLRGQGINVTTSVPLAEADAPDSIDASRAGTARVPDGLKKAVAPRPPQL
jgi:tetratricopeptide (TPR) repeat protein